MVAVLVQVMAGERVPPTAARWVDVWACSWAANRARNNMSIVTEIKLFVSMCMACKVSPFLFEKLTSTED